MTPNTTIYQSTVLLTVCLAVLTLLVPRKYFLAPFVLAACFVPTDQRIIMMDFDLTVLRMLVAVGVLRVFIYGEYRRFAFNAIDKLLLAWALCGAVIYVMRHGDAEAVINRAGFVFTGVGLYWLFRQNIESWSGIKRVIAMFAVCAILSLPLILVEWYTGANPFVYFGKVITSVRQDQFRCQAAFPHSIMMGLFWTILAPLFLAFSRTDKHKVLYMSAFVASIIIIMASASSTPILVFAATMCVVGAFAWRQYTSVAAWCLAATTAALHVVMNAPVWHLLARINVIGGSTGWHRYNLIDKAIRNFDEWVFLGSRSTDHWGFGLGDVTNQYVLEGVRGGAVTLLLFLVMTYVAMKTCVRQSLSCRDRKMQIRLWSFFAVMVAHCIGFIGVSYFGQITVLWYLTLAAASLFAEQRVFLQKPARRSHYASTNLTSGVCVHS